MDTSETKSCSICNHPTTPHQDKVYLCCRTFYETLRWDCEHCGARHWESLWKAQARKAVADANLNRG